jgi:hypothetical protein
MGQPLPNREAVPLGRGPIRSHVERPGVVTRLTAPTNTEGERTLPEHESAWSYHISEGWKMIDPPLGLGSQTFSREAIDATLTRAGFFATPSMLLGEPASGVWAEVYDAIKTREHLLILHTRGVRQIILAKGFHSLLDVVQKLGNLLDRISGPPPLETPPASPALETGR